MILKRPPNAVRRAMLAALAAYTGKAAAGLPGKSSGEKTMNGVELEYRRLLALWQVERKQSAFSSNTYAAWSGTSGKAIIAPGPAIFPFLIQELRKDDFWFNVPLELISRTDIANGAAMSEQAKAGLWLQWWDRAKA
jgi:hypothetical protein